MFIRLLRYGTMTWIYIFFYIFQMLLQNNFEPILLVAARTNWRFKIGISRGSSAVSRVQSYFRKFGNSARKAKANMELFIRSLFQFQVPHSIKFLHIHWMGLKNCWFQPTFMIFRSQSIWLTTNSGKRLFFPIHWWSY